MKEKTLVGFWKDIFCNHHQHKRAIIKFGIPSYQIMINSEELNKKLNISYSFLKPILDDLNNRKLITGFVFNELRRIS